MYTPLQTLYEVFKGSEKITIDSRKTESGDLFFALQGGITDGNRFAEQAINDGAIGAVVDNPELKDKPGCYFVKNVLETLQQLAALHRSHFKFPVIGLTGSNGKTTSKELLHAVLQSKFRVQATLGNLNNHIGVPLTLLSVRTPLDFLIVEMGANHQGEIRFLCEIANPDIGYITNIGKAHLEGFGGVEGVKKGKSELYRHLHKNTGKIFVNGDDPVLLSLLPVLPENKLVYYHPSEYKSSASDAFVHFRLDGKEYSTHLVGEYNLDNIASAIAFGKYFGIESHTIGQAISAYEPTNNRSQWFHYKGMFLILDAYNANPSSMKASIENFGKSTGKDKGIILGDMFELGEYAETEHTNLIRFAEQFDWKFAVFIGENFMKCTIEKQNYLFFDTVAEATPYFHSLENSGCTVLLKGSRGIALEKLLDK